MSQILAITFPIYGIIAVGYLIVAKGWFAASDMRTLGKFVLNVALPALLFKAVASRDIADVFHPAYMLVYTLGGLAIIAVGWAWFSAMGVDKASRAVAIMGCSCPNSGFIGYPVMLLVLPDLAGLILAFNMLVENIVLIPICLTFIEMAKPGQTRSFAQTIITTFVNVLKRPMVLALLAGFLVSLAQIPVPHMVDRMFDLVAASAAALSLIVVGGSMVGVPLSGHRTRSLQIAFGKLLLHPALVALIALSLPLLGLAGLPPSLYGAVVLSAAMPMFGIYAVLAQELNLEGAASVAMLATTAIGFLSLSVLMMWLT